MEAIQLDLFEDYTEERLLELRMENLEESQNKLRKGLFARHTNLEKRYVELHEKCHALEMRLALLEKNLSIHGK